MKRIYEDLIYNNLRKFNQMAFLIGPRQVGKTTVAKHIQEKYKESVYLNFDSSEDRKLIMSGQNFIEKIFPTTVLRDEKPLVIFDELHKRPDWKNYIKGFFGEEDFCRIIDICLVNKTGKYNQSIVNLYCDEFCGIVYENRIREGVYEGSEIGFAD